MKILLLLALFLTSAHWLAAPVLGTEAPADNQYLPNWAEDQIVSPIGRGRRHGPNLDLLEGYQPSPAAQSLLIEFLERGPTDDGDEGECEEVPESKA